MSGAAAFSARRRRASSRAERVRPDRLAVRGEPGEELPVRLARDRDALAADAVELEDGEAAGVDRLLGEGDQLGAGDVRGRPARDEHGVERAHVRGDPVLAARGRRGRAGGGRRRTTGLRPSCRSSCRRRCGRSRRRGRGESCPWPRSRPGCARRCSSRGRTRASPTRARGRPRACAGRGGRSRGCRARGRARRGLATPAGASRATPSARGRRRCPGGRPRRGRGRRGRGACPSRRRR